MLTLGRNKGESLFIGDKEIIITVKHVFENGHVLIGIEAPKHVSVHREEIYARIKKEKGAIGRIWKKVT